METRPSNGMGRKRRLRLRRSGSGSAGGSGRAGPGGEPGRGLADRSGGHAMRPDFDADAYLKSMTERGAPDDMVEFLGALLDSREDGEMPAVVGILAALKDGDYNEAKKFLKEAEQDGYSTPMYRYWILECEGELEEALALCEDNIAGGKDDMRWIDAKADILNQMGRAEERLELYEIWQKKFGEHPGWQAGRARALAGVGRLNEAEQVATGIVESGEHPGIACIALGEALMARGDHKGAVKMFDQVLDMDMDEDAGYIGKAEALAAMGRHKEAVEVCDMRRNETKKSGHLKRVRDRILSHADGQGPKRPKESPAGRARTRRGGSPGGSGDTGEMALTITLFSAMCGAIESAGVVRDLVHQQITEEDAEVRAGTRIMQAAMEQVPDDSQGVREAFLNAFRAARSAPVPGVDATRQIVIEELEKVEHRIGDAESLYAAISLFAAEFPDDVLAAVQTPPAAKAGLLDFPQSRHDHNRRSHKLSCRPPPRFSPFQQILEVVYDALRSDAQVRRIRRGIPAKPWRAAAQKIAERAAAPDATFALCAAAAAVLVPRMQDRGMRYMGESIKRDCDQIAAIMSEAGRIPLKRATLVTDAMLEGASAYPDDPTEASGEATVRAFREAHMQVSWGAAAVVFEALFGIAAGGLWTVSDDRDRFDSMYASAIESAGRMNPDMHHFFERMDDEDVKRPKDMDTHIWDFFYGASGLKIEGWAGLAAGIDYKAAACLPEHARMMDACRAHYKAALLATRME